MLSGAAEQAGDISELGGARRLEKTGAGALLLSGNNSYSGGTLLSAGTLGLGSDHAAGTGTITARGSVIDYGAGVSHRQSDHHRLRSARAAGARRVGHASSAGFPSSTARARSTRPVTARCSCSAPAATRARPISWQANWSAAHRRHWPRPRISRSRPGRGCASPPASAPIPKIGSLAGAGDLIVGDATTLGIGGNGIDTTFAGVISGLGGIAKNGAGTLILTGNSTYSGATAVNGGMLSVNGSIGNSAVTVNGGATLGGNGTVGTTLVGNGGAIAPGNSVGTLTVRNSLTFGSGSNYLVEVGTTADRTNVVAGTGPGNAVLSGGAVAADFQLERHSAEALHHPQCRGRARRHQVHRRHRQRPRHPDQPLLRRQQRLSRQPPGAEPASRPHHQPAECRRRAVNLFRRQRHAAAGLRDARRTRA